MVAPRGPDIAARVRASVQELEGTVTKTRAALQQAEAELARLETERQQIFLRLSDVYLPALGAETVEGLRRTLPAMYERLAARLREREVEQRQLGDALEEHRRQRRDLDTTLDESTERVERLAHERDRLAEQVARALKDRPHHEALAQEVRQTESRCAQAERRHAAAVLQRDEKTPAYEQDPLFTYLLRRDYGSPTYRAMRLVRQLDDWVAGQVDFTPQLRSYQLLRQVPTATEQALRDSELARDDRRQQLRALEKEIEDLHGLTDVVDEGERLYDRRREVVSHIEQVDTNVREAVARHTQLEAGRGGYHQQARAELVEFLQSRPIRRLEELARSTATPGDDELTGALARWDGESTRTRSLIDVLRSTLQTTTEKLEGVRQIDRRFHTSDYDASNSRFGPGFDMTALVGNFVAGALTLQQLWRQVTSSQRFEPTPYQRAGPVLETILWEVARAAARGGSGGMGRRRPGGGFGRRRPSRTTGGFGGFGGGPRTTGGFG